MSDKLSSNAVQVTAVIAIVIGAALIVGTHTLLERAKIDADRAVKEAEIHEKEATERTEERSQFWQKLIPWGSDEEEKND